MICDLITKYGLDRCTYSRVYEDLFTRVLPRAHVSNALEIGLGTLVQGAPSSMAGYKWPGSENWKPGNGLRWLREVCPMSNVYGIDIQEDVMFQEDWIKCFLCDSSDQGRVGGVMACICQEANDFELQFDLIIEDSLHELHHQIKTLRNFYQYLAPGGVYVMEDVGLDIDGPFLRQIAHTCFPSGNARLEMFHINGNHSGMVVIEKGR